MRLIDEGAIEPASTPFKLPVLGNAAFSSLKTLKNRVNSPWRPSASSHPFVKCVVLLIGNNVSKEATKNSALASLLLKAPI